MKQMGCLVSILLLSVMVNPLYAQKDFDNMVNEIAQKLAAKLPEKSRMAVADFIDLQGTATELGRHIAESFSVEFVNTHLLVVDRSRLEILIKELKFTQEALTNPQDALKLGKLAGVQYLITGTTTMLDNHVSVTIKAYDIEKGIIVAAQKGVLPRTDAINQLSTSQVGGAGAISSSSTMAMPAGNINVDALDQVNQIQSTPMKKTICVQQFRCFGEVCFENMTKMNLVLYEVSPASNSPANTMLSAGGKGCSPLILTNSVSKSDDQPKAIECVFKFRTTDAERTQYTTFTLNVEGCVSKSVRLFKEKLAFSTKEF